MKKIWFYGWVMALSFLWVLPALASTTSQTLTAQGRVLLFNNGSPTVPGLQQAVDKFKSAIQADPNDREARFFSAVSNVLLSVTQNSGNTVITTLADLAKSFGVYRNANTSLLLSPYDAPPMLRDKYNPPVTIPGGSQLQTFLAGPFLNLLDASLADLSIIDNQESSASTFKLILTASELHGPSPVEVDYGDILLLEASLRAMKSFILIGNAYDMNCSLRDIIVLNNAGIFQFERDLAQKYPDLMHLKTTNGAAELSRAKTELIKSIDKSRAAMAFIKTKRNGQSDYLFTFADQSEMDNAQLNIDGMTELENSLNENRPAIFSRTELFDLQLSNGDTPQFYVKTNVDGAVADAHDIWLSGSVANTYPYHIDRSSYSKTSTTLNIELKGQTSEWNQQTQTSQWCSVSYTVNAALSGNNITGGSVAMTDSCQGNSSFSINSGTVSTVASPGGKIDFNRLFGNTGKPPLDVRTYVPSLSNKGIIINDGNPPTPAFGGILPDMSDPALISNQVYSVPVKTITVDGDDTDWQSVKVNIVNTSHNNSQPPAYVKIKNVKLSRDPNYIYVMVKIAAVDSTKPLTVYATFYYGNKGQYLSGELSYDGQGNTTCTLSDANGTLSTDTSNAKLDKVAELRLPINKVSAYNNARLDVSTTSSPGQNLFYYDYLNAHILLPAPKDTGTVTCAANNGHGRIFITAYDGQAMNRYAFLGSAIMQSPGNFTISLFAHAANTYFYGWWDADDNGILSIGDYTGWIGPLDTTTGQAVTLNLNKRVMVDFTKVILPPSPQADGSLSFSAANITSTDSEIISYEWNFGDNTTAAGAEVNHTYHQAGDYQLTLKVKTKSGETVSRSTILHISAAAYNIDGIISGLANGKSITLYAYSASTGSYGFQSISGDGSALNYSITNLPSASDYTLFISSADYPGGYYDGSDGLTNAQQAATIDLSTSDKQNVNFTLPSAKTLTVQLNGVKAGDQVEVRAWSQSLGLMSTQTVTAAGSSVTASMGNLQAQGNYVVYIKPMAGNFYRDGYYQGDSLQPGSLSQASVLPMTDDTTINISMGNGYKITGTIKGLADGEIATVSAWSPGYRNGNAVLITGTGHDITYTISGLPSRPDYMVAIKVLGGGGGYYGGASQPLTTYRNALPVPLANAEVSGIDLTLPQGHSISGNITGIGSGGYAVVYAWSPSTGNYASTGITLPGTYSFTNLPPASDYKVGVYARNYLNPAPLIVDISQNDQVNQNFTLTTGGAILGTITVPAGTDNLRVMVCSAGHETCVSRNLHAPQQGGDINYFVSGLPAANDLILSLHLGNTVYFYDSTNGSSYLTSDPAQAVTEALTLASGQVITGINMNLSSMQTFTMTGKVQGIVAADKDIAVIITAWNNQGGRGSVVRNGNGTYSIPGLPAGNYYLMATAAGYSNMFYDGSKWGIGLGKAKLFSISTDRTINDLTLNKGYMVSGTLTDDNNKPLSGVYISIWDAGQKFGGGAVSLVDGSFKISGLPAGTYSLEVYCPAGDYVGSLTLSGDTTQNISVNKAAGVITGKVTGSGQNNAIIFVYDSQDNYVAAVVPSADGSGNYTYKIDNLPATDTYTIKVDTDGNYNTMEWTGTVTLSSTASSQVLNIGL